MGKSLSSKKGKKKRPPRERDPLGFGWKPGRDTKYRPEFCEQIVEFARDPDGTFVAFAAHIGVVKDTLYEWAEKHPEFKEAKKMAKQVNESAMMKLGLQGMQGWHGVGAWQSAWIFAMKARHGWREEGSNDDDTADDVDFDFTD